MGKKVKDILASSIGSRTFCDCLQEMRDYINTLGKLTDNQRDYLRSLIEENQTYGNRMEAAIYDYKEVLHSAKNLKGVERKIRAAKAKLKKL
jgi:chromosome condensin MukBEF complex kleisin-like MukF subunit